MATLFWFAKVAGALVAITAGCAAIVTTVKFVRRFLSTLSRLIDVGESLLRLTPQIVEPLLKIAPIAPKIETMLAQFFSDEGSTMRDRINQIEKNQAGAAASAKDAKASMKNQDEVLAEIQKNVEP